MTRHLVIMWLVACSLLLVVVQQPACVRVKVSAARFEAGGFFGHHDIEDRAMSPGMILLGRKEQYEAKELVDKQLDPFEELLATRAGPKWKTGGKCAGEFIPAYPERTPEAVQRAIPKYKNYLGEVVPVVEGGGDVGDHWNKLRPDPRKMLSLHTYFGNWQRDLSQAVDPKILWYPVEPEKRTGLRAPSLDETSAVYLGGSAPSRYNDTQTRCVGDHELNPLPTMGAWRALARFVSHAKYVKKAKKKVKAAAEMLLDKITPNTPDITLITNQLRDATQSMGIMDTLEEQASRISGQLTAFINRVLVSQGMKPVDWKRAMEIIEESVDLMGARATKKGEQKAKEEKQKEGDCVDGEWIPRPDSQIGATQRKMDWAYSVTSAAGDMLEQIIPEDVKRVAHQVGDEVAVFMSYMNDPSTGLGLNRETITNALQMVWNQKLLKMHAWEGISETDSHLCRLDVEKGDPVVDYPLGGEGQWCFKNRMRTRPRHPPQESEEETETELYKAAYSHTWSLGRWNFFETSFGLYQAAQHIDNVQGMGDERHKDPAYSPPCFSACKRIDIDPEWRGKRLLNDGREWMRREMDAVGVALGKYHSLKDKPTDVVTAASRWWMEAARRFGNALHVMEDFYAHTNWMEIAVSICLNKTQPTKDDHPTNEDLVNRIKDIMDEAPEPDDEGERIPHPIVHTGPYWKTVAKVEPWNEAPEPTKSEELYYPLVTGTFGALDTLSSVLAIVGGQIEHLEHGSPHDRAVKQSRFTCRREPPPHVDQVYFSDPKVGGDPFAKAAVILMVDVLRILVSDTVPMGQQNLAHWERDRLKISQQIKEFAGDWNQKLQDLRGAAQQKVIQALSEMFQGKRKITSSTSYRYHRAKAFMLNEVASKYEWLVESLNATVDRLAENNIEELNAVLRDGSEEYEDFRQRLTGEVESLLFNVLFESYCARFVRPLRTSMSHTVDVLGLSHLLRLILHIVGKLGEAYLKLANWGVHAVNGAIANYQYLTTWMDFDRMKIENPEEYMQYVQELLEEHKGGNFGIETREDVVNMLLSNPTHTLLAKDKRAHPLHFIAGRSAQMTVTKLAKLFREAVEKPERVQKIMSPDGEMMQLVEEHMQHPDKFDKSSCLWSQIEEWTKQEVKNYKEAHAKGSVANTSLHILASKQKVADKMIHGIQKALGIVGGIPKKIQHSIEAAVEVAGSTIFERWEERKARVSLQIPDAPGSTVGMELALNHARLTKTYPVRFLGDDLMTQEPRPDGLPTKDWLRVSRAMYKTEQPILVTFNNVKPSSKDWVGIFKVGDVTKNDKECPTDKSLLWVWSAGDQAHKMVVKKGQVEFSDRVNSNSLSKWPLQAGDYTILLVHDEVNAAGKYPVIAGDSFQVAEDPQQKVLWPATQYELSGSVEVALTAAAKYKDLVEFQASVALELGGTFTIQQKHNTLEKALQTEAKSGSLVKRLLKSAGAFMTLQSVDNLSERINNADVRRQTYAKFLKQACEELISHLNNAVQNQAREWMQKTFPGCRGDAVQREGSLLDTQAHVTSEDPDERKDEGDQEHERAANDVIDERAANDAVKDVAEAAAAATAERAKFTGDAQEVEQGPMRALLGEENWKASPINHLQIGVYKCMQEYVHDTVQDLRDDPAPLEGSSYKDAVQAAGAAMEAVREVQEAAQRAASFAFSSLVETETNERRVGRKDKDSNGGPLGPHGPEEEEEEAEEKLRNSNRGDADGEKDSKEEPWSWNSWFDEKNLMTLKEVRKSTPANEALGDKKLKELDEEATVKVDKFKKDYSQNVAAIKDKLLSSSRGEKYLTCLSEEMKQDKLFKGINMEDVWSQHEALEESAAVKMDQTFVSTPPKMFRATAIALCNAMFGNEVFAHTYDNLKESVRSVMTERLARSQLERDARVAQVVSQFHPLDGGMADFMFVMLGDKGVRKKMFENKQSMLKEQWDTSYEQLNSLGKCQLVFRQALARDLTIMRDSMQVCEKAMQADGPMEQTIQLLQTQGLCSSYFGKEAALRSFLKGSSLVAMYISDLFPVAEFVTKAGERVADFGKEKDTQEEEEEEEEEEETRRSPRRQLRQRQGQEEDSFLQREPGIVEQAFRNTWNFWSQSPSKVATDLRDAAAAEVTYAQEDIQVWCESFKKQLTEEFLALKARFDAQINILMTTVVQAIKMTVNSWIADIKKKLIGIVKNQEITWQAKIHTGVNIELSADADIEDIPAIAGEVGQSVLNSMGLGEKGKGGEKSKDKSKGKNKNKSKSKKKPLVEGKLALRGTGSVRGQYHFGISSDNVDIMAAARASGFVSLGLGFQMHASSVFTLNAERLHLPEWFPSKWDVNFLMNFEGDDPWVPFVADNDRSRARLVEASGNFQMPFVDPFGWRRTALYHNMLHTGIGDVEWNRIHFQAQMRPANKMMVRRFLFAEKMLLSEETKQLGLAWAKAAIDTLSAVDLVDMFNTDKSMKVELSSRSKKAYGSVASMVDKTASYWEDVNKRAEEEKWDDQFAEETHEVTTFISVGAVFKGYRVKSTQPSVRKGQRKWNWRKESDVSAKSLPEVLKDTYFLDLTKSSLYVGIRHMSKGEGFDKELWGVDAEAGTTANSGRTYRMPMALLLGGLTDVLGMSERNPQNHVVIRINPSK